MDRALVPVTDALLEEILDLTYPLWGEGLSRQAYARFNRAQLRTPWGAAHLSRVALVSSSGRLLSTAKRYELQARFDNRVVRTLGIGAVFTPPALRGRGFAPYLIEQLLNSARAEGYDLALLFSAIGVDYYQRLGFEPVPIDQVSLTVRRKAGAPAINVRAGEDRDIRMLAEMHEKRVAASGCRFSLEREPDFIRFTIARKRLLAGLGPPGFRTLEYFVVDEADRAAAYAVMLNTDGVRMVTECGDKDPSGARLGALLQVVLARTPHDRPGAIRTWLPPGFLPPQLQVLQVEQPTVILMTRPLQPGVASPSSLVPNEILYWLGDVV